MSPPVDPEELRRTLRRHAESVDVSDSPFDPSEETAFADSPERPRMGRPHPARVLTAAALIIVILASVSAVLAARSGDDPGQRVATDQTGRTGWYLPAGLGTEWELLDVRSSPAYAERGVARRASFVPDPGGAPAQLDVTVYAVPPTDPEAAAPWITMVRGEGAAAYEAQVNRRPGDVTIRVRLGSRLLVLSSDRLSVDEMLTVSDRWWRTDGREIATDPSLGLSRGSDVTWSDPVASGSVGADGGPPLPAAENVGAEVYLEVRRHDSGAVVGYSLDVPGRRGARPTGVDAPDRGASAGLTPDEQPRQLELPGASGPVWEIRQGNDIAPTPSLLGLFPDADVTIGSDEDSGSKQVQATEAAALAEALRPATSQEWADAVTTIAPEPDPDLLSPRLPASHRPTTPLRRSRPKLFAPPPRRAPR